MKRINILVIIFTWLLCTANNCNSEDCHKTISFINNSSKDVFIYFCYRCDTSEFYIPSLQGFNANNLRVKPNEKNTSELHIRGCFEAALAEKRVIVYIFDAEVIETIPRDTIVKYRMALKTIYPVLEEMENSDWTITYTGE